MKKRLILGLLIAALVCVLCAVPAFAAETHDHSDGTWTLLTEENLADAMGKADRILSYRPTTVHRCVIECPLTQR